MSTSRQLNSSRSTTSEFLVTLSGVSGEIGSIREVFSDGTSIALLSALNDIIVTADKPIKVRIGNTDFGVFQSVRVGTTGNDSIDGGSNSDFISSGQGNDSLNGGAGADEMAGGQGDDTYTVDNDGDVVRELGTQGNDTVVSSINFTLSQHLENLTLKDKAVIGEGNNSNNIIEGNSANNLLDGKAGNDTIFGGNGRDTVIGSNGDDVIDGGIGFDKSVYFGIREDYQATLISEGVYRIEHTQSGQVDMVSNVEQFEFADGLVSAAKLVNVRAEITNFSVNTETDEISFTATDENNDPLRLIQDFNGEGTTPGALANGVATVLVAEQQDGGFVTTNLVVTDGIQASPRFARVTQGTGNDDRFSAASLPVGVSSVMFGFEGNDTLVGSNRNDVLSGGEGNDILRGGLGNDVLAGGAGGDRLDGGVGADTYQGGDGFDQAVISTGGAGFEADQVDLGASDATMQLETVEIRGIADNQQVQISFRSGEVGNGSIADSGDMGLAARLQVQNAAQSGFVPGANLIGGVAQVEDEGVVFAGARINVIGLDANGQPDVANQNRGVFDEVALGTSGNDSIDLDQTTGEDYYINGGMGDDRLGDGSGQDFLVGGAGNDTLIFTTGNDSALGGSGNDLIIAGSGNLLADGQTDTDLLVINTNRYLATPQQVREAVTVNEVAGTITIGSQLITYKGIEFFQFNDVTLSLADLVNDAPSAQAASNSGDEDTLIQGSLSGFVSDSNVNPTPALSFSVNGTPPAGFVLNGNGTYSLNASDKAYQDLDVGESRDVTVGYIVADQFGATATNTLTITVRGRDDAPSISNLQADETSITFTAIDIDDRDALLSLRDDINTQGRLPGSVNNGTPTRFNLETRDEIDQDDLIVQDTAAGVSSDRFARLTQGTGRNDILDGTDTTVRVLQYGFEGNDRLIGTDNDDIQFGGDGNDNILGGNGRNIMTGGSGFDVFNAGSRGTHTITDLEFDTDRGLLGSIFGAGIDYDDAIDVANTVNVDSLVESAVSDNNGGSILTQGELQILLVGVPVDAISADLFI